MRNGNYGTLSSPQSRALRLVYRNAGELLRLIKNILDLAKIESGKMPTHLIETDLPELVEQVCLVFEPFIEEKALRLERTVGPNFPKGFLTDPNKMKSILENLVSNAVKFTESGVIRVDLRFSERDRGIQIAVSALPCRLPENQCHPCYRENDRHEICWLSSIHHTAWNPG